MSARAMAFSPSPVAKAVPPHLRKKGGNGSTNIATPYPRPLLSFEDYSEETAPFQPSPRSDSTGVQLPPSSPPSTAQHADTDSGFEPSPEKPNKDSEFAVNAPSVSLEASIYAPSSKKQQQVEVVGSPIGAHSFPPLPTPRNPNRRNETAPVQQYEPKDLVDIGKQCSNRLPPASAVQAMFLYEMQRQTESERLFHAEMFRLARSEKDIVAQAGRLTALEAGIRKLDHQWANSNNEARITATEVRLAEQHQKITECLARLARIEDRSTSMADQLTNLKQEQDQAGEAMALAIKEAAEAAATAASANGAQRGDSVSTDAFDVMKQEIDVLFKDRDGIINKLAEVNSRIDGLAKAVQQLATGSGTAITPSLSTATPVQLLPARTNHGDLVNLSVPKGKPAVELNGSVRADGKSFAPGKPWSG
ncbi:hypothetical protein CERZMDRAFT_81573 [Cercospora zeae-maydis SCOH1-5]|uniref:Uncharacterized protein n=1 Tax=Cercospora zeae-maydis SCOH1-5 TaxID=717836 RepID=A0A6A6FSK1_9PEZI|nr:hypothetical protein CERZMDRAFT_81573 [Cercospora zeae-maydis SCOH1-5]